MSKKIQLLDCTLRDGAYIVESNFGTPAIKGIIKKLQDANVDIIECGWLKDKEHKEGTTFFHVPDDLKKYIGKKNPNSTYVVMIDWDRYNLDNLPQNDGGSIDAIRVVFPQAKFREGAALCKKIKEKGYKVYFQAANTLGYSDFELLELAKVVNEAKPVALSVVDTFGAMYPSDLTRIVSILDNNLDKDIKLGFHSHNNQQLSFALSMQFVEMLYLSDRDIIVDSSLCGMGRGAGNTTTELLSSYLIKKYNLNLNLTSILDAIDIYMGYFKANYSWGYSTPYFLAGMYCTHVNNIAYLLDNHRCSAMDMEAILASMRADDRKKYDYDLLESKFIDYQNKKTNDEELIAKLSEKINKEVLILSPGKSIITEKEKILNYIDSKKPIVVGVNAIDENYTYDYVIFSSTARFEYAKEKSKETLYKSNIIVTSNVNIKNDDKVNVINFASVIKRGWEHFDNSVIICLRFLNRLHVKEITIAGFDGFSDNYSENYADISLPNLNSKNNWKELTTEIKEMFDDFVKSTKNDMNIKFLTKSKYE